MPVTTDKSVVITGAGHGLGKEIARSFLKHDWQVTICGRDQAQLDRCANELASGLERQEALTAIRADISNPQDVENLVAHAISQYGWVDALINNAGTLGPLGPLESLDIHEWLKTLEINLFGTMLMCRALIPHFKSRKHGKIVNLSGGGATAARPYFSAYAASKAAVVRLTETLAQELIEDGITVNAIAPGALNTDMLKRTIAAGQAAIGQKAFEQCLEQKKRGGDSVDDACELCIFLASAASGSITGRLISAVWDDWRNLAEHTSRLHASDIYTLRRILPKDRGLDW